MNLVSAELFLIILTTETEVDEKDGIFRKDTCVTCNQRVGPFKGDR